MRTASAWDWILIACFGAANAGALARLEFAPRDRSDVAIIYAPWVSAGDAIRRTAASGARLIALGRWPFVVIARPGAADFAVRASNAGALAVVDPGGLYGCSAASERRT